MRSVPIFTFALGEFCDEPLFGTISRRSNADRPDGRVAGYYNPAKNTDLLAALQKVAWGLRGYAQLSVPVSHTGDTEVLATPPLGPWPDVGLLVYRRLKSKDGKERALAPLPGDVETPTAGGKPLKDPKPLTSRSHWYYRLDARTRAAGLAARDRLGLVVNHRTNKGEAYDTVGILVLHMDASLQPFVSGYSPLDAIPFRVDLVPPAGFRAEEFTVLAELTPVANARTRKEKRPLRSFHLHPVAAKEGSAVRQFFAEIVMDDDPASKGKDELLGWYDVDVTIGCQRRVQAIQASSAAAAAGDTAVPAGEGAGQGRAA